MSNFLNFFLNLIKIFFRNFDLDKFSFQTTVEDSDEPESLNISGTEDDNNSLNNNNFYFNNIENNNDLIEDNNNLSIIGFKEINRLYEELEEERRHNNLIVNLSEQEESSKNNIESCLINNEEQLNETNFYQIKNIIDDDNTTQEKKDSNDCTNNCNKLINESFDLESSETNTVIENNIDVLTELDNIEKNNISNINIQKNKDLSDAKIDFDNSNDKNFKDQYISNIFQENLNINDEKKIEENILNEKKNSINNLTSNNNQNDFIKIEQNDEENNENCSIKKLKNKSLNLSIKKVPYDSLEANDASFSILKVEKDDVQYQFVSPPSSLNSTPIILLSPRQKIETNISSPETLETLNNNLKVLQNNIDRNKRCIYKQNDFIEVSIFKIIKYKF